MDESTNQAFPVPWNELKLYRHQDGINPHFGAKNEPLPPQDGLSLSPKYIQSWGKHSFELEVTHGFGASYFVELYEVSYTPGDHTSYRLLDLNTGQFVSYKCAPYAIRNEALHRERLKRVSQEQMPPHQCFNRPVLRKTVWRRPRFECESSKSMI